MNLKHFLSRLPINKTSRFNGRRTPSWNYREVCTSRCISPLHLTNIHPDSSLNRNPKTPMSRSFFYRFIHSSQETVPPVPNAVSTVSVDSEDEEQAIMNEFLSRFVWIMRGKLTEVYTDAEKKEIDTMLHIIVEKVVSEIEAGNFESLLDSESSAKMSQDFSEDLWKTVWEVSNVVLEDMKKAKKKEKMKICLQSEEVKAMTRFAGEIGIRGDLLRELRFKWAHEKLEDIEFYESLELLKKEAEEPELETEPQPETETETHEDNIEEDEVEVSLPKRSGKIKYKIYGLDLSKPKWEQVAEKIHESSESICPQEPKPISGKSKIVTEKLLSLQVNDDPSPLISEWIELLQPTRVDWIALLDKLKSQNEQLYFKVAEILLDEESFETTIRDYSLLTESYAKNNEIEKAEKIINKMTEKGIQPDILTKTTMVHMYSKSGNITLAKEAFETLKTLGYQPDEKIYNSMIMAYINSNDLKSAESLLREFESKSFKPSEQTFLSLLKSYAQNADPTSADRIATRMGYAGYPPSLKSLSYLVEAFSKKGSPENARKHFDDIIKLRFTPDDYCISRMISTYANKNLLDKGLQLLLKLEEDGVEIGVETYGVLIDWFGKLGLVEEVEGVLGKMSGEERRKVGVSVSLCDMYARVRDERKVLEVLGVLEGRKGEVKGEEWERVINGLVVGGFRKDAERVQEWMKEQGWKMSQGLSVTLQAAQAFQKRPSMMRSL